MAQPVDQFECLALWSFMDDFGDVMLIGTHKKEAFKAFMTTMRPLILQEEEH